MPSASKHTIKNVEDAVRRFKTDDLKAHVMPVFSEIKWSDIRDAVVKEKLVLNKNTISRILSKMFGQTNPAENEIKMRICSLKLIEVSMYPYRRKWMAYQLLGSEEGFSLNMDPDELDLALKRAMQLADISGMRQVTVHDGMYWVMVLPSSRNKRTRVVTIQAPSFFAYVPGCPYLFAARKGGMTLFKHVEVLKSALGFTTVKDASLEGNDLRGLLQMLKCRKDQCVDISPYPMQLDAPELPLPDISLENGNVTVSARNARIEYAENVFGTNPPAIKSMTFHAKNLTVPNPLWGGAPLDVNLTFHGSNVFETMKELTASGVMPTPYPSFMHQVLMKGKNVMVLQPTNVQQTSIS